MTELQVKTKKGSLKKFLAMFLAFCVCATTVFVDGAFAQAAEAKDGTISITGSTKVTVGESVTLEAKVTDSNAGDEPGTPGTTGDEPGNPGTTGDEPGNPGTPGTTGDEPGNPGTPGTTGDEPGNPGTPGTTGDEPGNPGTTGSDSQRAVAKTYNSSARAVSGVTWAVNNGNVTLTSTGNKVTVKGVAAGSAVVTATVKFSNGKTGTATHTITVSPAEAKVEVKLNKTSTSIEKGKTEKLTATVTGTTNTKVAWTTDKAAVATVAADGTITAVAKGEATITVTCDANKNVKATCKVTVTEPTATETVVPVSKITLNRKSTVYIVAGKKVTLGASVAPKNATNKKVTWKSNKSSVASVSSKGVVSTKKNKTGKATITATAGGKKATVKVEVVKKATKAKKVTLKKTASLKKGETLALQATLSPKKATSALKWTTSNKKVATVKDGIVTGKAAGVATITVKADKKTAKCVVTVSEGKASLSKTKGNVKVGKTLKITLKGKGDSIKSCTSSNKKIATVTNKGVVKGKKVGKADITVVTKKGKVATFKVTVKKK